MSIHFGTDGWRAKLNEGFTLPQLLRLTKALASLYKEERKAFKDENEQGSAYVLIGYDTRQDADVYAAHMAQCLADEGVAVRLSDRYCPTPALCWSVARDPQCIGGIMLTASHNPAQYLGVKLRMQDGGASPKSFTDKLERLIEAQPEIEPYAQIYATQLSEACEQSERCKPSELAGQLVYRRVNIMEPYLQNLRAHVDVQAIKKAQLTVVHDAMYGASRGYLSQLLQDMGIEVVALHGKKDPSFGGLHPEPITPWIDECCATVCKVGASAGLINDGDADRITAVDEKGQVVSAHKILSLVLEHLINKGQVSASGRVVSTVSASSMLDRQCKYHGIELCITPVGFKWIYEEMLKGDVILGGEESGGIGIPSHVAERDGLLMGLMLCEMMAHTGNTLSQLVEGLESLYGQWFYKRDDIQMSPKQAQQVRELLGSVSPQELAGQRVLQLDRRDGLYLLFEGGAWLLLRASGTEPLVRIYAEAQEEKLRDKLLQEAAELLGIGAE